MLSYEKSKEIVKYFYEDCLKFHKGCEDSALSDVALIKCNPFTPIPEVLNRQAVIDFVNGEMSC